MLDKLTKDCDVLLFSLLVMDHILQKDLWLTSREGASCQAELAQYHIPSLNQWECAPSSGRHHNNMHRARRGLCLNPAVHPVITSVGWTHPLCPNLMWLHQQVEDWCTDNAALSSDLGWLQMTDFYKRRKNSIQECCQQTSFVTTDTRNRSAVTLLH